MATETIKKPDESSDRRGSSHWRADGFEFDESRLELRVGGQPVEIEPKPIELLMWLLRHPGEVVTKEELLDNLWAGRVVSESVLTSCVGKLRQALGDDSHAIVKTVHGFGYRLTVPVQRQLRPGAGPSHNVRLRAGDTPPQRPNWRLVHRFDGSLGETWLVEHAKSGERRVLKFAFDASELSRLKREITLHRLLRETLGGRDDIVRVIDWNLEEPPCFIELEHGVGGDLAQWLERQGGAMAVPLETRLGFAADIADVLAAAHSVGVLHKDVKPSNVMVAAGAGGKPRLQLADFGSGGLVDDARLEALHITRMGFTQNVDPQSGTWTYLAPEVLAGQPPTTAADVYALGVLTFQLVVGDLQRTLTPGWERAVEDELLREDLGRCCDQDPARRFADAGELARRIRTLPDRRQARAAEREAERQATALKTHLEQSRLRRRWLAAIAGVASVGFIVALAMVVQVRQARVEAESQAAAAKAVNDYLVRDLLGAANPMSGNPLPAAAAASASVGPAASAATVATPGNIPVRALLDRAAGTVEQRFSKQPALEAAVRASLGQAYFGLAEFAAAAEQHAAAARLARRNGNALDEAESWMSAAESARELDRYDDADAHLAAARQALSSTGPAGARARVEVERRQGWLLYKRGEYDRAIAALDASLPGLRKAFGDPSDEVATALEQLSTVQLAAGHVLPAVASARSGLAVRLQVDAADHPRAIDAHATLGDALRWAGQDDEAEREVRAAHSLAARVLGPDHHRTLVAQGSLASMLQQRKRYDEAIALFEDTAARSRRHYGDLNYDTTVHLNNLGLAYADARRFDEATATLRQTIVFGRELLGPAHPELVKNEHNLADVLVDAGRWPEAMAIEERLLPVARRVFGPRHLYVGLIQRTIARALIQAGRKGEAVPLLVEARSILVEQLGDRHARVAQVDGLLREAHGQPAAN